MPPGTGDAYLTIASEIKPDKSILVTTPNKLAVADLSKKVNSSIIGVIENMSFMKVEESIIYPFGEGGGKTLSEKLEVPLVGQIPLDKLIASYCEMGRLQDITSHKIFEDIYRIFKQNR